MASQYDIVLLQSSAGANLWKEHLLTIAKGDIISANGSREPTLLTPIGADGKVLMADAASPLGMKWEGLITVGSGADNEIPHMDGTTGFQYSSELKYESGVLFAGNNAGAVTRGFGVISNALSYSMGTDGTNDYISSWHDQLYFVHDDLAKFSIERDDTAVNDAVFWFQTGDIGTENITKPFFLIDDNVVTSGTKVRETFSVEIDGTPRVSFYPRVADGGGALGYLFDTTTDLTTAGAEVAAFRNAGVDVLTIDKDGNVNIPTGAEYQINSVAIGGTGDVIADSDTEDDLAVWGGTPKHLIDTAGKLTWDGTDFVIDGDVGMSIASPQAPLHISADGYAVAAALISSEYLILTSQQSNSPGIAIIEASSSDAVRRGVFKGTRARGTLGSPSAVQSGDYLFSFLSAGYDGSAQKAGGAIEFIVDGTVQTGQVPTSIQIKTGHSTRTTRMTIASLGPITIHDDFILSNYGSGTYTGSAAQSLAVNSDGDVIEEPGYLVASATIDFNDTSQTTMLTLPSGAILWDIKMEVTTLFNGTAGEQIEIGITGSVNRYETFTDMGATGWKTLSLANIPDRYTGSTNITGKITDYNSDAGQGELKVYMFYSLF